MMYQGSYFMRSILFDSLDTLKNVDNVMITLL